MANPIIKEIKDEFYNKVHPITEIKAVFDENGTSLEEILRTTVVTDVDDELSNESVNPVQNRVITEALNSKANSSDIQELSEEIATKADSSTVEALSNTVDAKANSSDVNNAIERLYNSLSEALAALELNKNELVSGIAFYGDRTVFDYSIATFDCVVNRFARRISIKFTGVVVSQQLYARGVFEVMNIATGYWGLIEPFGITLVSKDGTYYRALIVKTDDSTELAIVAQETIPAGATISGYIEWPY